MQHLDWRKIRAKGNTEKVEMDINLNLPTATLERDLRELKDMKEKTK